MSVSKIAYDYVNDIPWEEDPNLAFQGDPVAYKQVFRNVFDKIPTRDLKIDFSEDVWNFNPYFRNCNRSENRINYSRFPLEIRKKMKFFALYKLSEGRKVSTVSSRVCSFAGVIKAVESKTKHDRMHLITTEDIVNEIEERNIAPSTKSTLYGVVYQAYRFFTLNYKEEYPVDIDKIKKLSLMNKAFERMSDARLPNIPDKLFVAIRDKAKEIMNDESVPHNDRVTAATIVILTQIGCRAGDVLTLEVDQIIQKKLPKSGLVTHYIHYKSEKPSKPYEEMLEFDIFCNSLCYDAVTVLKRLRKTSGRDDIENWLTVYGKHDYNTIKAYRLSVLPISVDNFRQHYYAFLHKYLRDYVTREWEGIRPVSCTYYDDNIGKMVSAIIYAPETRQYRVKVCSDLYRMGIPLVYIQRYMGHLSEYMLGYYVRSKDHSQENASYTAKLIREIEGENLALLGHKEGSEIVERIKLFIQKGKYDIYKDMDELLSDLGDKLVIRGKEAGVCVKTSLLPCSKDARTNEVLCAAGICPNLYHTYYMIDVTYNNYLVLVKTYHNAIEAGRIAEAKKEFNKIKHIVHNKLMPELSELEMQIQKQGVSKVLNMHPELIDIIENMDGIRREAEAWTNCKFYNSRLQN